MNTRLKGLIIGAATIIAICGISAAAKEAVETITASYRNIQLVVDGVTVEPKDADGMTVEPFIYDGTTYLPVRAVANAFDKEVTWDSDTYTVSLWTQYEKPVTELTLWNRPYEECTYPNRTYSFEEKASGYICWDAQRAKYDGGYELSDDKWFHTASVTYPLNNKATSVKGEFYIANADDDVEGKLKIYNSDGRMIYESPIMRKSTTNVSFNADVAGQEYVKFAFEQTCKEWNDADFYIKDPVIVSSDY